MGDLNGNLVGPTAALPDYSFAFNNSSFSDRILRVEIVAGDDKAADSGESNWSEDGSIVLRTKTLHISSPVLAAKSPFFYKLFSNGMMESKQIYATLRIKDSEEAALMELLSFIYCNTLNSKTTPELLEVLKVADKFDVASCIAHCGQSLRNLPMTTELALLYLALPSSLLMADAVKHFTYETKEFLALRYKEISECEEEIMNLPLVGIEAILSGDYLHVTSEDKVYDLALQWTMANYQKPEEQKEILSTRLGPYIRFPYMSYRKLRKVLTCNDLYHELAIKYVNDALFFKAEPLHHQQIHFKEDSSSTSRRFIERAYKSRPIKIVELVHPKQQYVVYFDLKHEECAKLFPSGRVFSNDFRLGERDFYMSADCYNHQQNSSHSFGLFLLTRQNGLSAIDVEIEYFARCKSTENYISILNWNQVFGKKKLGCGAANLFNMPWSSFISEDCDYFINGTLYLRVELTFKR